MPRFALVRFVVGISRGTGRLQYRRPYWYRDGDSEWLRNNGGSVPKHDDDLVIETMGADRFEDLDWTKTGYVDPDAKTGWMDRAGRFYGCDESDHTSYAYWVLKRDEKELEDIGWVRILSHTEFVCCRRLSAEQRNELSARGYLVQDSD